MEHFGHWCLEAQKLLSHLSLIDRLTNLSDNSNAMVLIQKMSPVRCGDNAGDSLSSVSLLFNFKYVPVDFIGPLYEFSLRL